MRNDLSDMTLLVVDDETGILDAMSDILREAGAAVFTAASGLDALAVLAHQPCDACLVDVRMPRMDGIELLRRIKEEGYETEVIVFTGYGSVRSAVEAIKRGAYEYISKPVSVTELLFHLSRLRELRRPREQGRFFQEKQMRDRSHLIGDHPKMQWVRKRAAQAACSPATVLITGESGTGKELVAHAIHYGGPRSDRPFVKINCGAMAQDLLLSDLFGHERGAFTGAYRRRQGRFEMADGGTIFLDEIGSASERAQVSLLRVLQEQEFERVGGDRTLRVNVRVIAATNRNLEEAMRRGEFRPDLYYRLNFIRIDLPSLRERISDVPQLVAYFLNRSGKMHDRLNLQVDSTAMRDLQAYEWPGNVRELENVIESAAALTQGELLTTQDLLPTLSGRLFRTVHPKKEAAEAPGADGSLREALFQFEREFLIDALHHNRGDVKRTAQALQISFRSLYRRIKDCRIDMEQLRR